MSVQSDCRNAPAMTLRADATIESPIHVLSSHSNPFAFASVMNCTSENSVAIFGKPSCDGIAMNAFCCAIGPPKMVRGRSFPRPRERCGLSGTSDNAERYQVAAKLVCQRHDGVGLG